jgi:hypothetical protein
LFLNGALALESGTGSVAYAEDGPTPANFMIAFIGDQGLGSNAQAVLDLIRNEGADAVVHSGDFDYRDDPQAWDDQITGILGPDFPYFAAVGNHDESAFEGTGGYQEFLAARMNRIGIPWNGELGVRSSFYYSGIFFALTAAGIYDGDHAGYIREQLATDDSVWRINSWHKNMRLMQVGGKSDETGWGVYEESRKGGSIIATAHEHSYSRTHLLSSCENQTVASNSETLVLQRDDPDTPSDEGRSFVFVSGLGGKSIRDQERDGPWWASVYTSTQGANYGALFGIFNYQENPRLAYFYFKDIDGFVADDFFVESTVGTVPPPLDPQLLSGRKLLIRNRLPDDESRNRLVFVSRDPSIMMARPGSAADPRCGFGDGGSIEVTSPSSGETFTASLPCENWHLLGTQTSPRGYRYRDPRLALGPCRRVTIAHGRMIRAKCMGRGPHLLDYDLQEGEAQPPVQVRVTTGAGVRYCSEFGGDILHDGANAKRFFAKHSVPPTDCP